MDNKINVLDKGFVRLVEHMGSDATIVQTARVSYDKGTKTKRSDRGLIRYLVRNFHSSPLEHVEFRFHLKLPLFIMQQLIRHRTSSINQISNRYSVVTNEYHTPDHLRYQDSLNKQSSSGSLPEQETKRINQCNKTLMDNIFRNYEQMIDKGIAREQARTIIPHATYTECYYKMDLHNLFHFLKLRLDKHTQWETRQYAEAMYSLIKPIVPMACQAFEDYQLNAVTFSKYEMIFLRDLLGRLSLDTSFLQKKLSKTEFSDFLKKIGHDDE